MALQRDTALTLMVELTNKNMCMIKAMREAYRMVLKLSILEDVEADE